MRRWFWNVLIALDQGLNALLGGNPDETISSRAHKAHEAGRAWGRVTCALLHAIDRGHCPRAVERDEV